MKKLILAVLLLGSSLAVTAHKVTYLFSYSYYGSEELSNSDGGKLIIDTDNRTIRLIQGREITAFQIHHSEIINNNPVYYCSDLSHGWNCSIQFTSKNNRKWVYIKYNYPIRHIRKTLVIKLLP